MSLVMQVSASVPLGSEMVGWRAAKPVRSVVKRVRFLPSKRHSDGPVQLTDLTLSPVYPLSGSDHRSPLERDTPRSFSPPATQVPLKAAEHWIASNLPTSFKRPQPKPASRLANQVPALPTATHAVWAQVMASRFNVPSGRRSQAPVLDDSEVVLSATGVPLARPTHTSLIGHARADTVTALGNGFARPHSLSGTDSDMKWPRPSVAVHRVALSHARASMPLPVAAGRSTSVTFVRSMTALLPSDLPPTATQVCGAGQTTRRYDAGVLGMSSASQLRPSSRERQTPPAG